MRKRIVVWGSRNDDEKVLLALELMEKENSVDLHCFSEKIATEEFYKKLMGTWRENGELAFPEGSELIKRQLSITDDLLPENIRTERADLINQAKAEWHFTVLSSKLYEYYSSEIETIKEKVKELTKFDGGIWDEVREFWTKVQNQMKDENLFKGQGYKLKKATNEVFDKLKELRKEMDEELNKASAIIKKEFMSKLGTVEEKIEKGLGLQPLFNELKKIQGDFRNADFNRGDKNKVWKRLDKAFKNLKEKKYGNKPSSGSSDLDRLKNRYNGLLGAIGRMEQSLNRDKKEKEFQDRRINNTDGQLELQLRQAKIQMIQQRVASKQERYDDMLATKVELEKKMVKAELKLKKDLEKKALEQKKDEVKEKIQKELKANKESLDVDEEKLKKAASEIKASKNKSKGAKVVVDDKKEDAASKDDDKASEDNSISDVVADIADKVGDVVSDITQGLEVIADIVEDKVEAFIDELKNEEE